MNHSGPADSLSSRRLRVGSDLCTFAKGVVVDHAKARYPLVVGSYRVRREWR